MARPRLRVEIQVECPSWRKSWPGVALGVRRLLREAVARPELAGKAMGQVAVLFSDDAKLRALNSRFRGKDKPTNVLSFGDPGAPLGGIAIGYETILREAAAQGKEFANHTKHMILHGFLHLLGFDHDVARAARLMEGLEIAILADMGIPNPYLLGKKPRA